MHPEQMMTDESGLQVDLIQDARQLEDLKEAWNSLVEKNETRTVELTYEWEMTYWKYFHQNAELFVLVVRKNGSVMGIAPLKLVRKSVLGMKLRSLEFIAAAESNYQDFITNGDRREALQAIWHYLLRHKDLWELLQTQTCS